MFALLTRHMTESEKYDKLNAQEQQAFKYALATTILLDRALTLTTLLRIALDPICRLAIVPTLL